MAGTSPFGFVVVADGQENIDWFVIQRDFWNRIFGEQVGRHPLVQTTFANRAPESSDDRLHSPHQHDGNRCHDNHSKPHVRNLRYVWHAVPHRSMWRKLHIRLYAVFCQVTRYFAKSASQSAAAVVRFSVTNIKGGPNRREPRPDNW